MPQTTVVESPEVQRRLPFAPRIALLNGDLLSDDALRRLARGATSVTTMSTRRRMRSSFAHFERRWESAVPDVPLENGGSVDDIREAMIACAQRDIRVIAVPPPSDAARFVARAAQGAAAAADLEVPACAVRIVRDQGRPGPAAWLTQTGERSGYGVLYAVGFARVNDCEVVLIEPSGGAGAPRTRDALTEALYDAVGTGVRISRRSDASPVDSLLRDPYQIAVHPVLDVPGGRALLRPGRLPAKSVTRGTPAAVVRLIEHFPGDVVAVFDGVRLLRGAAAGARAAATVALAITGAASLTGMAAPAAMAAPVRATTATTVSSPATRTATRTGSTSQDQTSAGVIVTTSGGHNGQSHMGQLHVSNHLDHPVTLELSAIWTSSGNHPEKTVTLETVTVQPGQSVTVDIPRPIAPGSGHGGGSYHLANGEVRVIGPGGTVLVNHRSPWTDGQPPQIPAEVPSTPANQVPPEQLHPDFRPVEVTGTQTTITGENPVPPIQGTTHAAFKGKNKGQQTPTPTPTATPHLEPHQVPTPTPTATPPQQPPMVVTGTQTTITGENPVPPIQGTTHAAFKGKNKGQQTPTPTPTATPHLEPHQVPTPTPTATPPQQPPMVVTGTGTTPPGTTTPGTTDPGPTVPGATGPGTSTPAATPTTPQAPPAKHALPRTPAGQRQTPVRTPRKPSRAGRTAAPGAPTLAHTGSDAEVLGAAGLGLLAGGAALVGVAGRRRRASD